MTAAKLTSNKLFACVLGPLPYVLQEYEVREDGRAVGVLHSVHETEKHRDAFLRELSRRRDTVEPGTGVFPVGAATTSEQPYMELCYELADPLYRNGRWVNLIEKG